MASIDWHAMSDRHYCSIMNDEVEIRKFVRAKHQQKNFDRLFEQRVQSYGDGHRLAFAACRILHEIVSTIELHPTEEKTTNIWLSLSQVPEEQTAITGLAILAVAAGAAQPAVRHSIRCRIIKGRSYRTGQHCRAIAVQTLWVPSACIRRFCWHSTWMSVDSVLTAAKSG